MPRAIAALSRRRCWPLGPTTCAASAGAPPASPRAPPTTPRRRRGDVILVAADLGPADVAELGGEVAGSLCPAAAVTAHAAIVARSLGIPMAVGLGEDLLEVAPAARSWSTARRATVVLRPRPSAFGRAARPCARARARASERRPTRDLPAVTRDGRARGACSPTRPPAEVARRAGGGGRGRGADPDRARLPRRVRLARPRRTHRARSSPCSPALRGRVATVRVLDFGGDKIPPFLRGGATRDRAAARRIPGRCARSCAAIAAPRRGASCASCCPMVRGRPSARRGRRATARRARRRAAQPRRDGRDARGRRARALSSRAERLPQRGHERPHARHAGQRPLRDSEAPRTTRACWSRRPTVRGRARRRHPARGMRRGRVGPGHRAAAGRPRRRRAQRRRGARRRGARLGPVPGPARRAQLARRARRSPARPTPRSVEPLARSLRRQPKAATQPASASTAGAASSPSARRLSVVPPFAPRARTERRLLASASRPLARHRDAGAEAHGGPHEFGRRPGVEVHAERAA